MAFEVNSVPLSETIRPGLPRRSIKSRQFARHAPARDRGVRDRRQAFPRDVVDDIEDAKPPAVGELVVDEIERPARVGLGFDQDRRPHPHGASTRPTLAHRQTFLAIEPVDAILARRLALLPQQNEQPPVAEAPALVGQFVQPGSQLGLGGPT